LFGPKRLGVVISAMVLRQGVTVGILKCQWRQALVFVCLFLLTSLSQSAIRSGERAFDFSSGLIADKPDLYLRSASFTLAEQCEPANPVMYVTVEIANLGKNPDLLRTRGNFVYAVNTRMKHWGNGVLVPAVLQGGTESVTFPIYYYGASPKFMPGVHRFVVGVSLGKDADEANYENNRFGPVVVELPIDFCETGLQLTEG
jgi:hypothetical protein